MLSVDAAPVGDGLHAGAATDAPARARLRRLAARATVLAALGLLVTALANVAVAGRRDAVANDLGQAHAAAARVPAELGAGDTTALDGDLRRLEVAARGAAAGSSGAAWLLAGRVGPNAAQLRDLRADAQHLSVLAAQAEPLRRALGPLGAAPGTGGAALLDRLDDLARGLNGYATAADGSADPSAPAMGRAASAAGLLPDLAGSQEPRTWTACQTPAGPCTAATFTGGLRGAVHPARAPSHPVGSARTDVLIIGTSGESLFGTANGGARWSPRAVFVLLFDLDRYPSITIRSPVATEQQAIQLLSRPVE